MMTIYKYPLKLSPEQDVLMPVNSRVLSVQFQRGTACLWAMVNPDRDEVKRRIYMAGTGFPLQPEAACAAHIGTVQMDGFVWHFFDSGECVRRVAGIAVD